jgi:hypothetical protein
MPARKPDRLGGSKGVKAEKVSKAEKEAEKVSG